MDRAYGDSLYAQLKSQSQNGQFEAAETTARELIFNYPGFRHADEAHVIAARASAEMANHAQAVKYALVIPDRYAVSPHREEALFIAAESYRELGNYFESADALLRLLSSPVQPEMENRALNTLRSLSQDRLGMTELDKLVKKYPASPLAGEMSLGLAKREFAKGNYDRAYSLLTELLYEFPQHKRSPEVRQLLRLTASRREDPSRRNEYIEPYKLGVVLPLTGNFARFGRYFEQGVTLAVDEFNATSDTPVSLVKSDSRGDPVDAVAAVRKLVVEEGVLGVIGAVLTVPTIAAAVECNAWHVPILSPVTAVQRIDEIGSWVFQTHVSTDVEVSALARVAREDLLLKKFAVLARETADKRQIAEYFVQEISSRGGVIVTEQYYNEGDTDFREQLEAIRDAAPEALFIPGEPEELILVLPQVSFYDMQIQLMGLSNWNSEKLLRLSERELEGAIFPGEGVHGKDRQTYQRFVADYEKRFGGEAHPVASAGYFGARLVLQSIGAGSIDRVQVRDFLDGELNAGGEQRMAQANSLSILKVRSGKVREFRASRRK